MKMGKLEKLFVNSEGHSQSVNQRAQELLSYAEPAPGQRYLDVGTGNGAAAIGMARAYQLEAVGVDVDAAQIRLARAASNGLEQVRFMTLDGRELPFDDGAFDIVSAFKVTHHIPNWEAALAEMIRVLKPGGHFVYSDLMAPRWLAVVGGRLVKEAGYPTAAALAEVAAAQNLALVHASKRLFLYDAVYRKDAA